MNASRPAVIIPVHNRRSTTLRCIELLLVDGVPSWADVYIIDDGSIDGTAEAVSHQLPAARIIRGDGNWWWGGAIEMGMRHAFENGATHFIWLNDDCEPEGGTLANLHALSLEQNAITGGVCLLPGSNEIIYGGINRTGMRFSIVPWQPGTFTKCEALCGNLVCIPRRVVEQIGYPDAAHFPHAHADLDFTLRAHCADIPVLVDHRALAYARPNAWDNHSSWMCSDIPVSAIWSSLWSKRSYLYFPSHWTLFTRHWGWRGGAYVMWTVLKRVPITIAHVVLPLTWRRKLWGAHSTAWKEEQRLKTAAAASINSPKSPEKNPD